MKDESIPMFITWVLYSLFVIVIVLLAYDVWIHTDRKSECVQQPLVYGARDFKERNNAEFTCTCFFDMPNSPTVFFNSQNMSRIP